MSMLERPETDESSALIAKAFGDDDEARRMFWEQGPDQHLKELIRGSALDNVERALDIGCGGGRNTAFLAASGIHVVALDLSFDRAALTRVRLDQPSTGHHGTNLAVCGDVMYLPCCDSTFDLVVAIGVLPVGGSNDTILRAHTEIARVLKPGATLLAKLTFSAEVLQESKLPPRTIPGKSSDEEKAIGKFADAWFTQCRTCGLTPSCPAEIRYGGQDNGRITAVGVFRRHV